MATKTTTTAATTTTDFNYEILEHIGIIDTSIGGWTKELNIVRFNKPDGSPGRALYDIRAYSPDKSRMTKGLRFREDEIKALAQLLRDWD